MEFTKFDLKNICNFQNQLKDDLKDVKKEIPLAIQKYEGQIALLNKLQKLSIALLGLNLIIPGNKTFGNVFGISIYLILCFSKWLEDIKIDVEYKYLFQRKDDLDETIDALELLKDFLRNKNISIEEKIFIIERLYLIYRENLKDILLDIEKEQGVTLKLVMMQK